MVNTVSIKDDDDIEPGTIVICHPWTTPLLMPDNVRAVCSQCGRVIQHRPHVRRDLVKVCIECMAPMIERDIAEGECDVVITPASARELATAFKKRRQ